jgi:hypothetical protein
VNPVPIALAFAGSVVLFASWVLFMTRELWWSTVEPSYLQVCDALTPARAKLARARVTLAHAGVALGRASVNASVKIGHELAHQFTAFASRPRPATNNWSRTIGSLHGWWSSR